MYSIYNLHSTYILRKHIHISLSLVRMFLYDRLSENIQLFNVSLWDSNRAKLFISSTNPYNIFLLMLAVCLLAIVVLGFGFYLWFFITGSEHSQVRLINILNVYLSVVCIGGGITTFIRMVNTGLGYQVTSIEHIMVGFHIAAITVTLLLISLATLLNQFKPEFYLELSVVWRHSVAVPTMLLFFILMEVFILYHCSISSMEIECTKTTIRTFLSIPATCISFIVQCIIIVDDVWGLKNILNLMINTNETPVTPLQAPAQGLQNQVVCIFCK